MEWTAVFKSLNAQTKNILEMLILSLNSKSIEPETLGWGPSIRVNKPSGESDAPSNLRSTGLARCCVEHLLCFFHTTPFCSRRCCGNQQCTGVAGPHLTSAAPRIVVCLWAGFSSTMVWDNRGSLLSRSWACANLETLRSSLTVLGHPWTSED